MGGGSKKSDENSSSREGEAEMPFAITLPDDDDEADITRVCAREK